MFSVVACGKPNEENNEENNANKGNNVIELFEGTWYCYKAKDETDTIDYREYPTLNFEITIKFSADNTYYCDFLMLGERTDTFGKYPKSGTYTVSGDSLVLVGDVSGVAKIDGTDLVLLLNDNEIQYYQRNKI